MQCAADGFASKAYGHQIVAIDGQIFQRQAGLFGLYFGHQAADLLKNTVFIAMANLPRTLALGFVNAVCTLLCLRYVVPLFFLPALTALISTLFLEPMFKPYMPQETPEDAA